MLHSFVILLVISFIILVVSIKIHSITAISILYSFPVFAIELVSNIPFGLALAIPLLVIMVTNKSDF